MRELGICGVDAVRERIRWGRFHTLENRVNLLYVNREYLVRHDIFDAGSLEMERALSPAAMEQGRLTTST